MAPVSYRTITSYKDPSSISNQSNRSAFQSKIPVRIPNVPKIIMKDKVNSVMGKVNSKPSSIIARSTNGNILKPPIKKMPTTPNLEWTKNKGGSSITKQIVKTKSIGKAKDLRNKMSRQGTLPQKYFLKSVAKKDISDKENTEPLIRMEKENVEPLICIEEENPQPSLSKGKFMACKSASNAKTLKELQNELEPEFELCESSRKQILNDKKISLAQLDTLPRSLKPYKENQISKQMERLTISKTSTKSLTKTKLKQPLSLDKNRCNIMAPSPRLVKAVDPYEEAMNSIRKIKEMAKGKGTSTPSQKLKSRISLFQSTKKSPHQTTFFDTTKPIVSDSKKQNQENKLQTVSEPPSNDKKLDIPLVKIVEIASENKSSSVVKSSLGERFGQQILSAGKNKKQDAYEMAMAQIRELKAKKSTTNKFSKSIEKSSNKLTPIRVRQPMSCFNKQEKILNPYEAAMAQIRELQAKTPPARPRLSPAVLTPRTPIQGSIQKKLFAPGNDSTLDITTTPINATPRHVTFNLCDQSSVYRPLKSLMTKSILKKQPRLTDISEHSETDSARTSEVSIKDLPASPSHSLKKLNTTSTPVSPFSINKLKHVDEFDICSPSNLKFNSNVLDRSEKPSFNGHEDFYGPKLRKVDPLISKPLQTSFLTIDSPTLPHQNGNLFSPISGVWKLVKDKSKASTNLPSILHAPKAIQSSVWTRLNYPIEQNQPEMTPVRDAPILTSLVLKNFINADETNNLVSPIKQSVKFNLSEHKEMSEKKIIDNRKIKVTSWLKEYSIYTDSMMNSDKEELQADEECISIFKNRNINRSYCRNLLNPVAKILNSVEEKHFIPVSGILE